MRKDYLAAAGALSLIASAPAVATPLIPAAAVHAVPGTISLVEIHYRYRPRVLYRDCTFYNAPFGYYGNPWCEGGWLSQEDRPIGWDRPPYYGWRHPPGPIAPVIYPRRYYYYR